MYKKILKNIFVSFYTIFIVIIISFSDVAFASSGNIKLEEVPVPPALYPQSSEQVLSEDAKHARLKLAEFGYYLYTKRDLQKAMDFVRAESFYTDYRVLSKIDIVRDFLSHHVSEIEIPWTIERVAVFTIKDYPFIDQKPLLRDFLKDKTDVYVVNATLTTVDKSPNILDYSGGVFLVEKIDNKFWITGYSNDY